MTLSINTAARNTLIRENDARIGGTVSRSEPRAQSLDTGSSREAASAQQVPASNHTVDRLEITNQDPVNQPVQELEIPELPLLPSGDRAETEIESNGFGQPDPPSVEFTFLPSLTTEARTAYQSPEGTAADSGNDPQPTAKDSGVSLLG